MEQMHSLLKRQLSRYFGDQFRISGDWQEFINAVNDAYWESDMDRGMLERSLELSSQELLQANSEVRAIFLAIPDLLFRIDGEGRILNYKAGSTTDLFLDPKELLGKRIQDVPLKQVSEKFSEAIQQVHESKTIISIEYSLSIQDRSLFFEARLVPLPEDQIVVIIRNITERKQVEKALQESENKFRAIINGMIDTVWVIGSSANIIDVNNSAIEVMGYSREELLSMKIGDIDADQNTKEIKELTSKMPTDRIQAFEAWHKTKDGRKFPVEINSSFITYGDKKAVLCIARDITEWKQSEVALKNERNLLRTLIDNMPEQINYKDAEGKYLINNRAHLQSINVEHQEEALGKTVFDFHPEELAKQYYEDEMQIVRTGKALIDKQEIVVRQDTGERRWHLTSKIPLKDDKGKVASFIGISRDITEQKRAMETLTLLSHTVKSIGESISITDLNNNLLFVNETFLKTYGYTEEEITGKSISIVSCDPITHEQTILNETIKGGWQGELLNRKKDGTIFPIFLSTSIVYDEKEQPIGLVGVATEITERKQAEKALQESQALYHSFVEHLPASVFRKDSKGCYVFVNSLFCKLKGLNVDEVLGKTPHELEAFKSAVKTTRPSIMTAVQYTLADQGADNHEMIMRTGKPIEMEEVYPQLDGTKKYFQVVKSPVFDSNGKIIGTQGVQFDITERKLAEEALQESNEKLRNIVEHSTNLFYSRNTDQVFTYLSPQAKDIFDCDPDEALVRFTDFMTDNSINKLGCELAEKAVQTGSRQEAYELELMSRKGRRVWVEIQEAPVVKDGKTISIVGAATDITERRWAEMALQVSEKKYRDIVTWAPVGIYQSTLSGKLLSGNSRIAEMLGYDDVNELVGNNMGQTIYYDEKDWERFVAEDSFFEKKVTLSHETRWKKKDGSIIWVLMTVHDVRDKSSEILYYEGFVFDITERKHAEEALRESEERYRLLVENSTDIVTEISAEGKYLYVSANVKSILDYEPTNLVGTNVLSRVYVKDKAAIGEILSKLGGSAMYRYRDHLGGWHWFESSGRVYYTSSGEQRMVMVSRDITHRRKAEQELELSRKQLQHFTEHLEHILEEERKRISRELHDELGQLLTILKFDLSWLKLEEVNSDSNTITRIDGMMESVNAALTSVKRIAREMRPPQLDALGLIGAMRWDIDQAEKKTGLKGIVTGELADVEIKGQISTVLYRVFREAMTNVLRHAQAKQIFIRLSQRLGSIIFTIRDDGRGITKKELKGTKSLGLVGVRERIRMIGGTFTIEGKPGSGTILTVEVPLKKKKKNGDSIS